MSRITKRFVDRLTAGPSDIVHWDEEIPRFGVRVKPSGAMSYIVQYRNQAGRSKRLTVGRVGTDTPDEARENARQALAAVTKGGDPVAEKRAQKADLTVAEVVDLYLKEGPADKPGKKASSWATDGSNLKSHAVPLLGRRMAKSLTPTDIQRFQKDVTDGKSKAAGKSDKKRGRLRVTGGAGTAWRATVVVAAMLAWAVARKLLAENPAQGVKLNKLQKRERFLSGAELARLGDAIGQAEVEGVNSTALNMIRVLLLSGARKTEVASAKGAFLDVEHGALRLPDSKTDEKVVVLGAPALALLAAIAPEDPDAWIFPATRGDGYFKGMPKIWKTVVNRHSKWTPDRRPKGTLLRVRF